jgi:hypothetical protein
VLHFPPPPVMSPLPSADVPWWLIRPPSMVPPVKSIPPMPTFDWTPAPHPVPSSPNRQTETNVSPFEPAHEAVPFASYPSMPCSAAGLSGQTYGDQARVLRTVPSQQQSDFDSSVVLRSLVDQGVAQSVAPAPTDDMSELLKLGAIVQAMGSRGLFPIQ